MKYRVVFHGMYDCHLFCSFVGRSVDEIISAWLYHNSTPNKALIGESDKTVDIGPAYLCPAILIDENEKEVGRFGRMVFVSGDTSVKMSELLVWCEAVGSEPRIVRALKKGRVGPGKFELGSDGRPRKFIKDENRPTYGPPDQGAVLEGADRGGAGRADLFS